MQLLTSLLLLLSTLTIATTTPLARRAVGTITYVSHLGSGCPVGSPLRTRGDTNHFTALSPVHTFSAHSQPLTESRKFCQLTLEVSHPQGTQFSIDWTRLTGYAKLDNGAVGVHEGVYYFAGEAAQTSTQKEIKGRWEGEYELKEKPQERWSACGGTQALSVVNSVRVETGEGVVEGRNRGEVWFEMGLKWRHC